MAANPSVKKREKERARAEKQKEKDEKRKIRKAEADNRPPGEEGVDPDLAGIVWGPQPVAPELVAPPVSDAAVVPRTLVSPASSASPYRKRRGAAGWSAFVLSPAWRPALVAAVVGAVGSFGVAEGSAQARCPNEAPADPACVPLASWALPTVHADVMVPRDAVGKTYVGGGFDLSLLSWFNNIDSFGPSQGAIRLGASYLQGQHDRSLVAYRASTVVSFEGNASRRFLIPTFGTALGGLWHGGGSTSASDKNGNGTGGARHVATAEGMLGLYLLYTRHVVVDVQGGVVIPLSASQALFGPRGQLTCSFALW